MRNNTTLLLTVFLVLSAVVSGGLSQPGGNRPGGSSKPKETNSSAVSDPFRFSGCDVDEQSSPEELCAKCPLFCPAKGLLDTIESNFSNSLTQREEAVWGVPKSQIRNIDFMIATLADPTHTHLSLAFDRSIQAIQKGAQASGQNYLFSRAWMPWESETKEESTDYRLREELQVLQDKKEDLPGLLIFRQEVTATDATNQPNQASKSPAANTPGAVRGTCENQGNRFLFVLVVGETPTGGIRRTQFQTALKMIHGINNGQPRDACYRKLSELRILGTTFSGSLDSLNELLAGIDRSEFPRVDIESGTTTDWRSITRFSAELSQSWGANARFISMQQNGAYSLDGVRGYLRTRGYQASEIASLSEDETALGRNFISGTESSDVASPKFYFPRDISQLRASYQREMQNQTKTTDTKQAPRSSLPLNLDVTGSDDDSVPTYAPLQTPLSQESVMKGIVTNLRKHHSKVVIVNATNVLDSLFLCQYLRVAYPEGRLVVLGADLLFQRDPDDRKLDGILSATTYPLLPGIDDAIGHAAGHVDQVIADSSSIGVFNAMVSELAGVPWGEKEAAKLLSPPPKGGDYASYGWPQVGEQQDPTTNPGRPALWLVEIGKGGYWPIALLDEPGSPSQPRADSNLLATRTDHLVVDTAPEEGPFQVNYGLAWKVMWWLFGVFLWGYLYLLLFPPSLVRSELGVTFSLPGEATGNGFLFLAGLLFLGVQVCFLYPWIYRMSPVEGWGWLWWFLPLVSVAGLVAAAYQGFGCRDAPRLGWSLACLAGAVVLVSAVFLLFGTKISAGSSVIFFARRFTHLDSGVSPAAPIFLLFAGFLWCCWYGMDGVQINRPKLKLLPPLDLFSEEELPDIRERFKLRVLSQKLNEKLFDILHPFCKQPWAYIPAAFALLATIILLGGGSPVEVVEVPVYPIVVDVLLGIAAFLMVFLCTRVILVWLECKDLLRRLENVKLRRSFGLQEDLHWGTLWRLASDAGVINFYQRVNREMECLDDFLKFEQQYFDRVSHEQSATKLRTDASDAQGLYYRAVGRIYAVKEKLRALIAKFQNEPSANPKIAKEKIEDQAKAADTGSTPTRLKDRNEWATEVTELSVDFQNELSEAIGRILLLLTKEWALEPPAGCAGAKPAQEKPKNGSKKGAKSDGPPYEAPSSRAEVACTERCACLYFLNVILIVLRRIRSLVFGVSGLFVFIVLALNSYPFEPQLQLRTGAIVLFLGALGSIGYVYGQIYRNRILSRVTSTSEDELGWDFWVRMAGFVAVPVLSLLAAQFPALNRVLFSWVEPALQSVR